MEDSKNKIIKSFMSCLNFATEAHKYQKRKDVEKTPYINHPIGVAYILSEEAELSNVDLLRGCLLHDTVEDTAVVIEDIFEKFGNYVGNLVKEVTDDKTLPKQMRKDLQVTHASSLSSQSKVVKLADKLYNLRDLERSLPDSWSEKRRQEYYEWALNVCCGLQGVSPKMEEKLDALFRSKGLIGLQKPSGQPVNTPQWENHDELKSLVAAADFAAKHHRSHFIFNAESGIPYINHLVSVAYILSEEAGIQDSTMLCAAILSDALGKGNASMAEIETVFGKNVGAILSDLTHDHSQTLKDQFQTKIRRASTMCDDAKMITLATVIDECRWLDWFEPEDQTQGFREQYLKWAQDLIHVLTGTHFAFDQKLDKIYVAKIFQQLKCT